MNVRALFLLGLGLGYGLTLLATQADKTKVQKAKTAVQTQLVSQMNRHRLGEFALYSRVGPREFYQAEFAEGNETQMPFMVVFHQRGKGNRIKGKALPGYTTQEVVTGHYEYDSGAIYLKVGDKQVALETYLETHKKEFGVKEDRFRIEE